MPLLSFNKGTTSSKNRASQDKFTPVMFKASHAKAAEPQSVGFNTPISKSKSVGHMKPLILTPDDDTLAKVPPTTVYGAALALRSNGPSEEPVDYHKAKALAIREAELEKEERQHHHDHDHEEIELYQSEPGKPLPTASRYMHLKLTLATEENLKEYGVFIGDVLNPGLGIPFYKGSVVEGKNLNFVCTGRCVIRTAKILKRPITEVNWLERHMDMTQLFMGIGTSPYVLVLGKPTHNSKNPKQRNLPDLTNVRAFLVPGGCGVMIHQGTWHDFPICGPNSEAVTVFTANSEAVVEALVAMKAPGEMNQGDVFKLNLAKRFDLKIMLNMTAPPSETL